MSAQYSSPKKSRHYIQLTSRKHVWFFLFCLKIPNQCLKSAKLYSNSSYKKYICAQKNYSLKSVIGEHKWNKMMKMELLLRGTKLFFW